MQDIASLYNQSRHTDVVSLYQTSTSDNHSDPLVSQYVAASYFKLGNYHEAYQILKAIYSVLIDNVSYLSLYAATCRNLGRLDESKMLFERALNIDSSDIYLKNNYSNLLIDLNRFSEARSILAEILESNPDYEDAKLNLHRVDSHLLASSGGLRKTGITSTSSPADQLPIDSNSDFSDPLFFAFSKEEVERTAPFRPVASSGQFSDSIQELQTNLPPSNPSQAASDQIKLAYLSISEGNPQFALKLCTQAYPSLRNKSELFSCAGDAYISLKQFAKAETAYLHSIALGGNSFKNFFNLATISMLKKDLGLADFYLLQASYVDASDSNLVKMKKSIHQLRQSNTPSFSFTSS